MTPSQVSPAELIIAGAVATLTFNRPSSYNAIEPGMALAIRDHAQTVEHDSDVRVLVLRGAGRGFCAGGDIQAMGRRLDDLPSFVGAMLDDVHIFLETLARMPQIVISCVHGVAAGAGLSIAAIADLCIASEDAVFVPSYLPLGVSPDCGGTASLVRAAGVQRSLELYLLDERISAARAREYGFVNRVVPREGLDAEVAAIAARICGLSSSAVAHTKRLVRMSLNTPLAAQLEAEKAALLALLGTETYREAVAAFLRR